MYNGCATLWAGLKPRETKQYETNCLYCQVESDGTFFKSFDQHSIHITEMCRNLRADLKSFCPVTAQDFDQGNPAEQDGSDAQRDQHPTPGPTKAFWRRIFKKKKKSK